jgi:putative transposase
MIVGYNVSTTIDTELCLGALENVLDKYGIPELINTDQGSQYTSSLWITALKALKIRISMDGKDAGQTMFTSKDFGVQLKMKAFFCWIFKLLGRLKME